MSLRLVPPPPTDAENWKRLMNFVYVHEEDALFEWLREVRAAIVAAGSMEPDERERSA